MWWQCSGELWGSPIVEISRPRHRVVRIRDHLPELLALGDTVIHPDRASDIRVTQVDYRWAGIWAFNNNGNGQRNALKSKLESLVDTRTPSAGWEIRYTKRGTAAIEDGHIRNTYCETQHNRGGYIRPYTRLLWRKICTFNFPALPVFPAPFSIFLAPFSIFHAPFFVAPLCYYIYYVWLFFSVTELVHDILFTHLRNSFGDHLYIFFMRDFFGGKDKKTIILEIIWVWNVWQP